LYFLLITSELVNHFYILAHLHGQNFAELNFSF